MTSPQPPYWQNPQGQPGYQGQQPAQGYHQPPPGQHQQQAYGYTQQGHLGVQPNQPYQYSAPPGQQQYPPLTQQGQYPQYPQGYQQQAPYGQQPPAPQSQYGQHPPQAPYGQGQYPPSHYPPQSYGAPQQGQPPHPDQQWHQQAGQHQYGAPANNFVPTPASPGYDLAQKAWVQPVDTVSDVEALRKAMKGMGCDERALIRVLVNPKYSNPWALAQLVRDYNSRFMRDLAKDIESETRGDFETCLLALIRGPLENDVYNLSKALNRAGTDEDALNDVLLCRSNADIRAICAEYRRVRGKELHVDVKDDVDDTLYRFYSMVLSATRAEESVPVNPAEIDQKVTELQRATEGTIGANAVAVAQIFTSSNEAQIRAINEAYRLKYHRSLESVIEKEFRGDMEDALLRILYHASDRARLDAERLHKPLNKSFGKNRLFINRLVSLYWDQGRLHQAKMAYKPLTGSTLAGNIKSELSGDYEDFALAIIGEK
ncbi:annexin a11 [Fusarium longipes]|uniref:Annexin a11 n=1 Tax=Fusarium longipes TaxID=694270 RepID=A0A395SYW8_9HYPO|nr:annexin a11 [Fusarium longipes]